MLIQKIRNECFLSTSAWKAKQSVSEKALSAKAFVTAMSVFAVCILITHVFIGETFVEIYTNFVLASLETIFTSTVKSRGRTKTLFPVLTVFRFRDLDVVVVIIDV